MNDTKPGKKLILMFAAILLALNASFAALYFLILSEPSAPAAALAGAPPDVKAEPAGPSPAQDDTYYRMLFSYGDAVELCSMEARSRNSNLIQLSVNEHSTRFNPDNKMYLVKLDSQIGTPLLYDEKTHTCEIDPETQGVSFYKEIFRRKAIRSQ